MTEEGGQVQADVSDLIVESDGDAGYKKSQNFWKVTWLRMQNNRFAVLCLYFLALLLLVAVLYPYFMSFGPLTLVNNDVLGGGGTSQPASLKYPAGVTDHGRDLYSRLLAGAATSVIVGAVSTAILMVIGVLMGVSAGYYGGRTEEIISRIIDFFLAVPFLLVAAILVRFRTNGGDSLLSDVLQNISNIQLITLTIGIFGWTTVARVTIAQCKQVLTLEYISAARVLGAGDLRIIFKHVLPNMLATLIVLATLAIAGGILSEAGLSFLGFGDPVQDVSWGLDIFTGQGVISDNLENVVLPGLAIFFVVLAVNLLGDALRDALDPRLRD